MNEYLLREPETLSGGQKQRVAIAGILALNCDIIILDEATSMLDPQGTEEITKLILELKEKYNKTIITITHDLGLAMKSDRVILLREGKILLDKSPEEVFKERELLLSSNLDMPFSMKALYLAQSSDILKDKKELTDALWEYHLKK
jgi:energy-coupling factor transport system ATP-binding protein